MKISPIWLREFVDLKVDTEAARRRPDRRRTRRRADFRRGRQPRLRHGDHHQPRGRHEPLRRGARVLGHLRSRPEAHRAQAARREGQGQVRHRTARAAGLRAIHGADCSRHQARAVARAHRAPPRDGGRASHQQRRRRQQLHPHRDGPSHARLRSRHARGRQDHRAPRPRRRKAEDAGRRRAQARFRRPGHRRCQESGRARRRHGRLRHHDHRPDAQHPDRVGVVRPGERPPDRAPPRHAHRRLASLRARRRLGRNSAGLPARGGTDPRNRRRPTRRRAHRRHRPAHRAPLHPLAAVRSSANSRAGNRRQERTTHPAAAGIRSHRRHGRDPHLAPRRRARDRPDRRDRAHLRLQPLPQHAARIRRRRRRDSRRSERRGAALGPAGARLQPGGFAELHFGRGGAAILHGNAGGAREPDQRRSCRDADFARPQHGQHAGATT